MSRARTYRCWAVIAGTAAEGVEGAGRRTSTWRRRVSGVTRQCCRSEVETERPPTVGGRVPRHVRAPVWRVSSRKDDDRRAPRSRHGATATMPSDGVLGACEAPTDGCCDGETPAGERGRCECQWARLRGVTARRAQPDGRGRTRRRREGKNENDGRRRTAQGSLRRRTERATSACYATSRTGPTTLIMGTGPLECWSRSSRGGRQSAATRAWQRVEGELCEGEESSVGIYRDRRIAGE
jgi:hypothetical protein